MSDLPIGRIHMNLPPGGGFDVEQAACRDELSALKRKHSLLVSDLVALATSGCVPVFADGGWKTKIRSIAWQVPGRDDCGYEFVDHDGTGDSLIAAIHEAAGKIKAAKLEANNGNIDNG